MNSLFKLKSHFLDSMDDSIELGRSFVAQAYQRRPESLLLLWRGLCAFIAQNPRYRFLFGPVSISNDYSNSSRDLIVAYLKARRRDPLRARWVQPRHPYVIGRHRLKQAQDIVSELDVIEDVSTYVSSLESDGKKVPILLKQYLKLNARILGFNVDACFANALDGLMIVDTLAVEPRFLRRLMGDQSYEGYIAQQLLNSIYVRESVLND